MTKTIIYICLAINIIWANLNWYNTNENLKLAKINKQDAEENLSFVKMNLDAAKSNYITCVKMNYVQQTESMDITLH